MQIYKKMNSQFSHPFSKLAKNYRTMRRNLPVVISNIALNDFKRNFKRQGYVNRNGVFIPWKRTKSKRARTIGRRSKGILIGTGRMLRSMRGAPNYNEARVVSNLPYAAAHNEGVKKTVTVKEHSRNRYRRKIEKTRTKSGKYRNRTIKIVTKKGSVKSHKRRMKLVARPFMITSKTINDETEKYIFKELDKIWNS